MNSKPKLRKWRDLERRICSPEEIAENKRQAQLMIEASEAEEKVKYTAELLARANEAQATGIITMQEASTFRKLLELLGNTSVSSPAV